MTGRRRDRILPGLVSVAGPAVLKSLGCTWRVSRHGLDPHVARANGETDERFIISLWHSTLLPLAYIHRDEQATVLVSRHGDGELIVRALLGLGYRVARGSSTRGGAAAMRELVRVAREGTGDLALTPDGPKGPARRAQPGVAYLSAMTGFPVLPLALVSRSVWRFRSWDRFQVPKPFTRIAVVAGEPIRVPREVLRDDPAPWLVRYERAMAEAEREAARIAGATPEPETEEAPRGDLGDGADEGGARPDAAVRVTRGSEP